MPSRNWLILSGLLLVPLLGAIAYAIFLLVQVMELEEVESNNWSRGEDTKAGIKTVNWRVPGEKKDRNGPHPWGVHGKYIWGECSLWFHPSDPSVAVAVSPGRPWPAHALLILAIALPLLVGYVVALLRTWKFDHRVSPRSERYEVTASETEGSSSSSSSETQMKPATEFSDMGQDVSDGLSSAESASLLSGEREY